MGHARVSIPEPPPTSGPPIITHYARACYRAEIPARIPVHGPHATEVRTFRGEQRPDRWLVLLNPDTTVHAPRTLAPACWGNHHAMAPFARSP